jgi:hypothetical protein
MDEKGFLIGYIESLNAFLLVLRTNLADLSKQRIVGTGNLYLCWHVSVTAKTKLKLRDTTRYDKEY